MVRAHAFTPHVIHHGLSGAALHLKRAVANSNATAAPKLSNSTARQNSSGVGIMGMAPSTPWAGFVAWSTQAEPTEIVAALPLLAMGTAGLAMGTYLALTGRTSRLSLHVVIAALFGFMAGVAELSNIISTETSKGGVPTLFVFTSITLAISSYFVDRFLVDRSEVPSRYLSSTVLPPAMDKKGVPINQARWVRYGVLGKGIRYILLLVVAAIVALEGVWRIGVALVSLETFIPVYTAWQGLQMGLLLIVSVKLGHNTLNTMKPLAASLEILPVLAANCMGIVIGILSLLNFAFTETPLGRFLRLMQLYTYLIDTAVAEAKKPRRDSLDFAGTVIEYPIKSQHTSQIADMETKITDRQSVSVTEQSLAKDEEEESAAKAAASSQRLKPSIFKRLSIVSKPKVRKDSHCPSWLVGKPSPGLAPDFSTVQLPLVFRDTLTASVKDRPLPTISPSEVLGDDTARYPSYYDIPDSASNSASPNRHDFDFNRSTALASVSVATGGLSPRSAMKPAVTLRTLGMQQSSPNQQATRPFAASATTKPPSALPTIGSVYNGASSGFGAPQIPKTAVDMTGEGILSKPVGIQEPKLSLSRPQMPPRAMTDEAGSSRGISLISDFPEPPLQYREPSTPGSDATLREHQRSSSFPENYRSTVLRSSNAEFDLIPVAVGTQPPTRPFSTDTFGNSSELGGKSLLNGDTTGRINGPGVNVTSFIGAFGFAGPDVKSTLSQATRFSALTEQSDYDNDSALVDPGLLRMTTLTATDVPSYLQSPGFSSTPTSNRTSYLNTSRGSDENLGDVRFVETKMVGAKAVRVPLQDGSSALSQNTPYTSTSPTITRNVDVPTSLSPDTSRTRIGLPTSPRPGSDRNALTRTDSTSSSDRSSDTSSPVRTGWVNRRPFEQPRAVPNVNNDKNHKKNNASSSSTSFIPLMMGSNLSAGVTVAVGILENGLTPRLTGHGRKISTKDGNWRQPIQVVRRPSQQN